MRNSTSKTRAAILGLIVISLTSLGIMASYENNFVRQILSAVGVGDASARPTPPATVSSATERVLSFNKEPKGDEDAAGAAVESEAASPESAANYTFSVLTNGTFTDMSSGTTQLVAAAQDDTSSSVTNIGFDFYFLGTRYSQFSANSNGFVRLGSTAVSSSQYTLGTASTPLIAALGSDNVVSTTGKIHYKVTGSAPNRVLTIEFLNETIIYDGAGATADGTEQVRLYESTGVIELVYGAMSRNNSTGFSNGMNPQYIGFSFNSTANTFAAVDTNDTVTTSGTIPANQFPMGSPMASLNSPVDGSRKIYRFTPSVPTPPTGLNFTAVSPTGMTLNWTDSPDETTYAIYRSTDGTNYTYVTPTAQNAVSYIATGLDPATTYFWQIYAISDGALSAPLSGSQGTNPPGNISCSGAGGNWSNTATWTGGAVPSNTDNVTVGSGCSVTVDAASSALSLTVQGGGTVEFEQTTARTLTVAQGVAIQSGGTIRSNQAGTQTGHVLSVGRDLINDGTLDLSTNADTAGAGLTFTGASNNTFSGSGSVTDIRTLTVNKGTSNANVLEVMPANFTIRGVTTDTIVGGWAVLTNGTLKVSGTFTGSSRVFATAGYTIGATAGFWLNNPNYTVTGQSGSPTVTGLFRMSQGTFNIGTATGNSMGFSSNSTVIIEGGAINAVSRFGVASAANVITYNQSGGTITVCTIGNTSTTIGSFDLGTSSASTISMTGGTIITQLAASAIDYRMQSGGGVASLPGGTLQLGNASSGAAKTFNLRGVLPFTTNITNTTAGHTGAMSATVATYNNLGQNINIASGTTFNAGNNVFLFSGDMVNDGTLTANGTSTRFITFGTGQPQNYTGSGTVTAPMTSLEFQSDQGFVFGPSISNIVTNRIINFIGNVTNSGKLTLGNGGSTTGVMQIGNTTTPTAAGTFDQPLNFNLGSGGQVVSILRTTAPRTVGNEINPSRTLTTLSIDENDLTHPITIAGGDITVTGALTLTNGRVITGSNTLVSGNAGTVTRTAGYVDGNFKKTFTASGSKTFEVGTANGYSPVTVNATAGTFPAPVTASATQTAEPHIPVSGKALSRYWTLTASDITANLTFAYLDPTDIPGTANESNFAITKYDSALTQPGGTVDTGANTATISGVTSFSNWTLAEPSALTPPTADLAITKTDGVTSVTAGGSLTYTITASNAGPDNASGATVADTMPASLTGTWTCIGAGGGTCTAAGSGNINDTVNLPAGGSVTYVVTATLSPLATGTLSNTATVAAPAGTTDPNPANNSATDTDTITPATTGPITVTSTAGSTTPTDYPTLKDAIDAINAGTHQGAITVKVVSSTTETATSVLNSSGAGSANYSAINIFPTNDGVSISGASVQGRGLIELNGADNVTIDGDNPNSAGTNRDLTIQNTAANTVTFASVVRVALAATVVNTADNVVIKNLNILGNATGRNISTATSTSGTENASFGILAGTGASTTSATTAPVAITSVATGVASGATANNLTISNNNVQTAARGISINGAAATNYPGLQITGNSIGNPTAGAADQVYSIGITAQGSSNGLISNNKVWVEGYNASSTATHGINVGVNSSVGTFTIERNQVLRVKNSNAGCWSAYGINLGGSNGHTVQNNFVAGVMNDQTAGTGSFGTSFGAYGIRIGSGTGHKIYHNSVNLSGVMGGVLSTNSTSAFLLVATSLTGVDVRNNIFANTITGGNPTGTRNVAIMLPSGTSSLNLTENNNAYYVSTDANSRLAQVGTTFGSGEYLVSGFDPTQTSPATNFRAYTSTLSSAGTNDNASFATTEAAPFTSATDLHIPSGISTRLESGGAAVGVTTDIDLEARNATTPDIGADEFAGQPPAANDIAASTITNPVNGSTITTTTSFTPTARFTNNGTATQTNVTVRFRIVNASSTEVYNQTATIASIAPLQTVSVTFPAGTVSTAGAYTDQATAELAGDADNTNDSVSGSFAAAQPLGGSVSVGVGQAYTSLTNPGGLFEAINAVGLSGDTMISITSDLTAETGAVVLNQIAESGPGGYTLTIKPSGAAHTISGTSASSAGLITINGADRVVFDGSLGDGTDRSLTLVNLQTTSSTVIWVRSPNSSNGSTNNTFKNLIITGTVVGGVQTTAGILTGSSVTLGGDAEAANSNNTIQNCQIFNVQNSLYLRGGTAQANFDQNWIIKDNELGTDNVAAKNTFRGLLIGNATNFSITGNNVHGIQSSSATASAMSGIQLAVLLNGGTVANNTISDIKNISTSGTGAFGLQIGTTSTASNVTIANNFISNITTTGSPTVTSNSHGMLFNGATTGYKVYNNTVNISGTATTGSTSAVLITSAVTGAGAIDLRNNILANTQTGGATTFAVINSSTAAVINPINYNNYFATNVGSIGGVTQATLSAWQTATGGDANSKAVDPMFVSSSDLHLMPSSTMIDAGITLPTVTNDIDGTNRPVGAAFDIGADEWTATANITGRITTSLGQGIKNVTVVLSGGGLSTPVYALTGSFGYYTFPDLPTGRTYTISLSSKRFNFTPSTRNYTLYGDILTGDFVADPVQ